MSSALFRANELMSAIFMNKGPERSTGSRLKPQLSKSDRDDRQEFRQAVGSFAYRAFDDAGVLSLALDIFAGKVPSQTAAEDLLRAGLPILGKLVEIQRVCRALPIQNSAAALPFDVLLFFPLATALEESGFDQALVSAQAAVSVSLDQTCYSPPLYLAIDRWNGNFDSAELLSLLRHLHGIEFAAGRRIIPLGPSTAELKLLARQKTGSAETMAVEMLESEFFDSLKRSGIASIEGGNDLLVHRLAAEAGLPVIVGQDISRTRLVQTNSGSSAFLDGVFTLRKDLLPTGNLFGWAPWSPAVLDSSSSRPDAPLGMELLTAIALARLLLPEVPVIRAPLSLMGCNMSQVALQFGANNLGFVAANSETAEHLGIKTYTQAAQDFQSAKSQELPFEEDLCQVA